MVKGMSATELIVALAVGLIVIVGLGYLVWTWLAKGGGQITESYCRARLVAYCTEWSVTGFKDVWESGHPFTGSDESFAPGCDKFPTIIPDKDYCQGFLNPVD